VTDYGGQTMKSIDRWSAEKAGIEIVEHTNSFADPEPYFQHKGEFTKWTLDDARCLTIAEAKFSICTIIEHDICGWSIECFVIGQAILNPKKREEYKNKMYMLHDMSLKKYRIVHALPERFAPEHIIQAKILCIEAIKQGEE